MSRLFIAFLGWFFIAIAVLGTSVELSDAHQHHQHDPIVGVGLIIIFGGAGALLVRHAHAGRRPAAATSEPPSTLCIRAAQKRGGRVTATEVAADGTLSFEEAKLELEKLSKGGACEVVVAEAGILVYRFPELERPENKNDFV